MNSDCDVTPKISCSTSFTCIHCECWMEWMNCNWWCSEVWNMWVIDKRTTTKSRFSPWFCFRSGRRLLVFWTQTPRTAVPCTLTMLRWPPFLHGSAGTTAHLLPTSCPAWSAPACLEGTTAALWSVSSSGLFFFLPLIWNCLYISHLLQGGQRLLLATEQSCFKGYRSSVTPPLGYVWDFNVGHPVEGQLV